MPDPRYSQAVLSRFKEPAHAGALAAGSGIVLCAAAGNQGQGAQVHFALRVDEEKLQAVAFGAYGSPFLLAGSELAAEQLSGAPVAHLAQIAAIDLSRALAAPPERLGELLIIEDALRKCWQAWENRQL